MRGEPLGCLANGVGLDGPEALCVFAVNSDEFDAHPHRRDLASSRASGSPGLLESILSVVGHVARPVLHRRCRARTVLLVPTTNLA